MFKITIEETVYVPTTDTVSFLKEERHYTDEEIDASHHWMRTGEEKGKFMKKIHGEKEVPSTRKIETKIFEQTVETLDLKAVIRAVNNIPGHLMYDPSKVTGL